MANIGHGNVRNALAAMLDSLCLKARFLMPMKTRTLIRIIKH